MSERRTYTDEEKQHACHLYLEYGPRETANRTGIPENTILSWANRAGLQYSGRQKNLGQIQATKIRWELRRLELVHRAGEAAEIALERALQCLQGTPHSEEQEGTPPDLRGAKEAALTFAILVDKSQLLSGAATSRQSITTDPAQLVARAAELDRLADDELAKRRTA